MALLWPVGLVGLVALPIVVWLHRRRSRAVPVAVPSLRFLDAEDEAALVARATRVDVDLVLALVATAAVALVAAGPVLRVGEAGRTVHVVVDTGPAMAARHPDGTTTAARAERVVDRIAAALGPADRLVRVDAAGGDVDAAARRAGGGVRVVVTDRVREDLGPDAVLVGVGDGTLRNAGLVAVTVIPAPPAGGADVAGVPRVFVAVRNDGPAARTLTVATAGGATAPGDPPIAVALEVPAGAVRSATLAAPALRATGSDRVRLEDQEGALAADDEVRLEAAPLRVAIATPAQGLSLAHAAAVRRALDAAFPGWVDVDPERASVRVATAAAPYASGLDLVLHPIAPGAPAVRAPAAAAVEPVAPPLGRDLDVAGVELVYALDARAVAPWPLLRVRAGPAGATVVEVLPDPLAGSPAPADTALWPLLVENVARMAAGAPTSGGHRVVGLLAPDEARLGRFARDVDLGAVARAAPDRPARERSLRLPLVALAVASWGALWGRAARRRVA